jgi:hypothetical protein
MIHLTTASSQDPLISACMRRYISPLRIKHYNPIPNHVYEMKCSKAL